MGDLTLESKLCPNCSSDVVVTKVSIRAIANINRDVVSIESYELKNVLYVKCIECGHIWK